ncbi:MAG: prolipoprotein diacylglyceryl transferase [Chloroflexi bacterium]|nr:prolipoprotein diacylglyceryl transferase [Chloroflexota bacterium]
MLPTFELGPWQIGTYGLLISLALIISGMWSLHRLLRLDYPPAIIVRGFSLAVLGGFAAFQIPYLINYWLIARYGLLARLEGQNLIWAIGGAIGVAVIHCWMSRTPLGRSLDLAVLPVPLGLAIGRLGCFAAGCCYGRPTDSWLGMYLPDEHGVWMERYPTQLLSSAVNLLIFFTLLAVERYGMQRMGARHGWPFDGFLALLFLDLFSLKRFGMAFLRQSGATPLLGPFSWMHLNALAGLVVATALIFWNLSQTRRMKRDTDASLSRR